MRMTDTPRHPPPRFGTCSWKYDSWRGIREVYGQYAEKLADRAVIRLHGPDREAMDERAGKDWSRIVEPRDGELSALNVVLSDLRSRGKKAWIFVNNHFEGCAPLTIQRMRERL